MRILRWFLGLALVERFCCVGVVTVTLVWSFVIGLLVVRPVEASSILASFYGIVQSTGTPVTRRPILNFKGAGVSVADNAGNSSTDITITGGGATGYQTIQAAGSPLPQQPTLNFPMNVTCLDDPGNTRTNCTPTGGGGGASISSGDFASTPACTTSAFYYSVTNSPYVATCDGSSGLTWRAAGNALPDQPIATADFATTIGTNATWTDSAGGTLHGVFTTQPGFGEVNGLVNPVPGGGVAWTSTTYYGMNMGRGVGSSGNGGTAAGAMVFNSGNGKLETIYFLTQGGFVLFEVVRWSNITTATTELVNRVYIGVPSQFVAVRISFDGMDTLTYSTSLNGGATFETLITSSVAAFLGAQTDHGIMGVNSASTVDSYADFYNFVVTTP